MIAKKLSALIAAAALVASPVAFGQAGSNVQGAGANVATTNAQGSITTEQAIAIGVVVCILICSSSSSTGTVK